MSIIIKLTHENKDYYLEWSYITDSPTTYGMSLEKFKKYYKSEYGRIGLEELPERLERVEKTGCSSRIESLDDLLSNNRAGVNEKTLTKNQIIGKYCLQIK